MSVENSGIDFALVSFFLFLFFFVSLIFYLRREDRREGYPLEDDASGRVQSDGGFLFKGNPKTFRLPFGRGELTVPNNRRDRRVIAARRSVVPGSPLQPTGNPMIDGVGPAAYAERAKVPDLTAHGDPKIVPMRIARNFVVAHGESDPRGMRVLGTDGVSAGVVSDLWVDRAEWMIRYLEVTLAAGGKTVMLPMTMALIDKRRKVVKVDAITAAQFADVPGLSNPDQITFYEEERVTAYYGGGFLYATPERAEPFI
jgi:photosynthetic reaction center H subunit